MNVLALSPARKGSLYPSSKVVRKLKNPSCINLMPEHLNKAGQIEKIVLATSEDPMYIPLVEQVLGQGMEYCETAEKMISRPVSAMQPFVMRRMRRFAQSAPVNKLILMQLMRCSRNALRGVLSLPPITYPHFPYRAGSQYFLVSCA